MLRTLPEEAVLGNDLLDLFITLSEDCLDLDGRHELLELEERLLMLLAFEEHLQLSETSR